MATSVAARSYTTPRDTTLRTADPTCAKRRGRRASQLAEQLFAALRENDGMTHDQIKALLRRYYDDSLGDEKRMRICAGEDADAAVRRALHLTYGREIESAIVEDLAFGRIDAVSAEAASLLARNGIAVDAASTEFRTLCYEL